jgi:separase
MLLQELQAIQSDAASSMAASSSISSSAGRTAWWAQRVQLDQRMAALLQQMDKQWLGAWRCLLLPPAEPEVAAAAAAAAADYVAEFFSGVLDEAPKQLLCQLCGMLLVHPEASTTPEVHHALLGLTQLAGQRGDGQVITRLMAGLAAAQAAVCAAAASSGEAACEPGVQQLQACDGVQRAADLPTAPGSSSSSSLVEGAATAQARSVAATPAAKPRRVRFTAVSAMGDADACDDDANSSVRPSGARAVRCAQSKRPVDAPPEVAVPPSIARHAARRSRLQAMSSSTPAAARAEGSRPSCGMSRETPARRAARGVQHVLQQAGGPVPACDQPAAAGACGRQAGAVLLVLDGSCQQLPWESCPGLLHQHLCR